MLDVKTRQRIDTARDILVGKVPDPKSQVDQITLALMYKFMDDIDAEAEEYGGNATFFVGDFARYSWRKIVGRGIGAHEATDLYDVGIRRMGENPGLPPLFRSIFNNAYLPYRDPETLRAFLQVIDEFEYDNSERLGDAFEYLLSIMGSQGDAGQFRTPRHIIDFIVEIVDPKKGDIILDPACGTAGFLISAYKHIAKTNENAETPLTPAERARLAGNVSGYDISPDMVRLSLVNLYLHRFPDPDIFEYDTLTSEDRWNEYANVILANPPFMSPKGGIRPHNRFSVTSRRSEVLFVDYIAEHLTPDGRAGVIVPEGIIFQSQNAHKSLRKMLVGDYLVAVVSLPPGVFNPYSGVKTSILILDRSLARRSTTIGFFKVAADGFDLGAQRREIDRNDLPAVNGEVVEYLERLRAGDGVEDFAPEHGLVVEKERIGEDGEFNLGAERYRRVSVANGKYPYLRIGDICTVNPKKRELNGYAADTEVSFVPMSDLNEHRIWFHAQQTRLLSEVSASYSYFRNDDVLLARVTPCFENGKAGIAANLQNGIGFGSSEFHVLRAGNQVLSQWLYYCGTHPAFRASAIENMTGTGGLQRIPRSFVEDFEVPLPPLEVQREIVSEIEGYQRVIDGARAVVENWRPRIAVDPEWPVVELGEVCTPEYGYTAKAADEGDTRFVRITDISEDGYLRVTDPKFINLTDDSEKYVLTVDDILVARTGATYGKTMRFEADEPSVFASYLMRLRFTDDQINPKYYWVFAQSDHYWQQARSLVTGGGQPQFNGNAVKKVKVPVPPSREQSAFVEEIQAERELVDANWRLIERMEGKVREVVGRVWGDRVQLISS